MIVKKRKTYVRCTNLLALNHILYVLHELASPTITGVNKEEARKDTAHSKLHDSSLISPDLMATQQTAMALALLHRFNINIFSLKSFQNLKTKETNSSKDDLLKTGPLTFPNKYKKSGYYSF